MYKKLLFVISCLGMVGCGHNPIILNNANAIKNKEVAIAKHDKPNFTAFTPGRVAGGQFGILGALIGEKVSGKTGNEIIAEFNIEDPAPYIAEKLSAELAANYGTTVSSKPMAVTGNDVAEILKSAASADLVLDIVTHDWRFAYFATSWSKYRIVYLAGLRLIDTRSGEILATGTCSRDSNETPTSPTQDELLANNAERLKKELREAADFCVSEFKSKALNL